MITLSAFNQEMRVLEARFRGKLCQQQKELFFVAIRSALTDKELRLACDRIVDSDAIVFPSPNDVIRYAWDGDLRWDAILRFTGSPPPYKSSHNISNIPTYKEGEYWEDDSDEWEEI
jgi:hypothetical protein